MNIYDSIIKGSLRWPERPREAINSAVCVYLLTGVEPDLDSMDRYAAGAFEMLLPVLQNQLRQKANASKPRPRKKADKQSPGDDEGDSQHLANGFPENSQNLAIKIIPSSYSSERDTSEEEPQERSSTEVDSQVNDGVIPYAEIIAYLNDKSGKHFRNVDSTKRLIRARFREGYTLEDFKRVIDVKCSQWLHDVKMAKYLQPSTLFGTKFEGYANETAKEPQFDTLRYEEDCWGDVEHRG